MNDEFVTVILDTGASIPVVNKSLVGRGSVFQGKQAKVFDWKNQSALMNDWAVVKLELGPFKKRVACLVLENTSYNMLIPRPLMKEMKLNLHFDDRITFGEQQKAFSGDVIAVMRTVSDIGKRFPNVVCNSEYPPPVKFFEVPFKLVDETPIRRKPYTLSRAKQDFVREELVKLKQNGIIRESTSPFASPILLVSKPNGTWRMCTDYRFINDKTELISWPLPNIDEIITETGGSKVFSTVDLLKGFWQQPLTESTKKFSAFVTPFGTYEYNVNPFGWKNSPKFFQKMMDEVLNVHRGYCRWYIDDIIIFSKSEKDHHVHLQKVFESLDTAKLKVNLEKSLLFQSKVVFLGRNIDGFTKSTKEESVAKVRGLKEPTSVKQVQQFLGLCGHFRAFIKDYSKIARPLTKLTLKDAKFDWSAEHQKAFDVLKEKITENPVLTLPDFEKPFILTSDASDVGTGAVLSQKLDGKEHAIGYHSYTFNKAEGNYSTSEKEMLAVLKAVHYFRTYLEGQKFLLHTDHSALKELLTTKEPKGRIARWIHKMAELDFVVVHRPGRSIGHADALSRLPQESDRILCVDASTSRDKIFIPTESRGRILEEYHDSADSGGHDGVWRTYLKISRRFRWPNLRSEVAEYVKSCKVCQVNKAKFKARGDRMCLRANDELPMNTVRHDFAELSKRSGPGTRTRAFLVAIDRNTRFAVARAGGQDAQAIISLMQNRVFRNTKRIISDHAKVFRSTGLRDWAAHKGIEIVVGSPYNSKSNGLAERLIRDLKMFISMYPNMSWKECLEAAVRHHNRSYSSTIGCSPGFALSGNPSYLPADDRLGIKNILRLTERRNSTEEENENRSRQKKNFNRRHASKLQNIAVGDQVLVRRGNTRQTSKFCGPFQVSGVEEIQGVLKRVIYSDGRDRKYAAISNVLKFHPRGDELSGEESNGSI